MRPRHQAPATLPPTLHPISPLSNPRVQKHTRPFSPRPCPGSWRRCMQEAAGIAPAAPLPAAVFLPMASDAAVTRLFLNKQQPWSLKLFM